MTQTTQQKPAIKTEMAYIHKNQTLKIARIEEIQTKNGSSIHVHYGQEYFIVKNHTPYLTTPNPSVIIFECLPWLTRPRDNHTNVFIANRDKGIFIFKPVAQVDPNTIAILKSEFNDVFAHTAHHYRRDLTRFDKPACDGQTGDIPLNQENMMQFMANRDNCR